MKIFGVVGWKNTGKTTLVAALVSEFTARGFRVSTIKHSHSAYKLDKDGTDSALHRDAGAAQTGLVSDGRWALLTEQPATGSEGLAAMLDRLDPCDLVLVEGFKTSSHPKIECIGAKEAIYTTNPSVVAIAQADSGDRENAALPSYSRDNVKAIAGFIANHVALT